MTDSQNKEIYPIAIQKIVIQFKLLTVIVFCLNIFLLKSQYLAQNLCTLIVIIQEIISMRNNKGFTVMELLTVIGIIGVLASIAVPNFITWRNNSQLSRAAQDVYSQFQKTKFEAVRRNAKCMITFGASSFQVYVDADNSWDFSAGDQEISQVNLATYPGVSLDLTEGGGDGLGFLFPNDGIAFFSNGFPVNSLGALTAGEVFLKNQNNKKVSVEISKAGNVKITQQN